MPELMDGERRDRVRHLVSNLIKAYLTEDMTRYSWHLENAEDIDLFRMSRELRKIAADMEATWSFRRRDGGTKTIRIVSPAGGATEETEASG